MVWMIWVKGQDISCLSESLHVVLRSHLQHSAAAADTDVVLNELDTGAVQGLHFKVLSQGTDWQDVVWSQVALSSVAKSEHCLQCGR